MNRVTKSLARCVDHSVVSFGLPLYCSYWLGELFFMYVITLWRVLYFRCFRFFLCTLNYVVKKGYVFKTYEGILIMEGFRTESRGTLQSNQFVFSVNNANLADSLMRLSGRHVELKYNEYLGALPWRGYSNFIVEEILSVK